MENFIGTVFLLICQSYFIFSCFTKLENLEILPKWQIEMHHLVLIFSIMIALNIDSNNPFVLNVYIAFIMEIVGCFGEYLKTRFVNRSIAYQIIKV